MSSLFHDLPRTPATIAAVRGLCDARGLPAGCGQTACRRAGRCRSLWVADPQVERLRLPPCLLAVLDILHTTIREARDDLFDLEAAVATIRRLPDPAKAAQRNVDHASAALEDDPFELEDWAD